MGEPADTNAAIWKSAEAVEAWTAEAERQERSRQAHRHFLARLLPFADQEDPGAAARRRNGRRLDRPRWDNHVRYIMPLGLQLEFLRSAGFEGIDVYWKQLENLIYGGRRPAANA